MSMMRFIPAGCVIPVLIVMCAVALVVMLSGNIAESAYSHSPAQLSITLTQPQWHVAAAQSDATTAFREEEAGFSAFYRVPAPTETDTSAEPAPRLNVRAITATLLSPTTSADTVRAGAGSIVALGDNYGIVSIPMFRTTEVHVPSTSVNVYYDDRGWIVAYLPVGEPAALIWRHDASYGAAGQKSTVAQGLKDNLLILAINEALTASDPSLAPVTHESAGYYDWENPDCNAFMVFQRCHQRGCLQRFPYRGSPWWCCFRSPVYHPKPTVFGGGIDHHPAGRRGRCVGRSADRRRTCHIRPAQWRGNSELSFRIESLWRHRHQAPHVDRRNTGEISRRRGGAALPKTNALMLRPRR